MWIENFILYVTNNMARFHLRSSEKKVLLYKKVLCVFQYEKMNFFQFKFLTRTLRRL